MLFTKQLRRVFEKIWLNIESLINLYLIFLILMKL